MSLVTEFNNPITSNLVRQISLSSRDDKEFILYQPNPTKQMLLYEMATSSSVFIYLKMNSIQTTIRNLTNTEFMSENGHIPVVIEKDKDKPMCGFKEVFWNISRRSEQPPDLLEIAYMDWIESKFLEAELYACWCDKTILNDYTRVRYTYDLPWPVSTILFNRKRNQIQNKLSSRFRDFDSFLDNFNQFLTQVNKLIGNRPFCPMEPTSPSPVAALIYGHATSIILTNLNPKLKDSITKQRRIVNLVSVIEKRYLS